jgi:hypothetical protein
MHPHINWHGCHKKRGREVNEERTTLITRRDGRGEREWNLAIVLQELN